MATWTKYAAGARAANVTTPSYAVGASDVVLAFVASNNTGAITITNPAITGGTLTWVAVAAAVQNGGQVRVYQGTPSAALTGVTTRNATASAGTTYICVVVISGASSTLGATATSTASAVSLVVNAQAAGSLVFGVAQDFSANQAPAYSGTVTQVDAYADSAGGNYFWVARLTNPTAGAGNVTLSTTSPTGHTQSAFAVEVKASAGTTATALRSATASLRAITTVRRSATAQLGSSASRLRSAVVQPQATSKALRSATAGAQATAVVRRSAASMATDPNALQLTLRGTATLSGVASRTVTKTVGIGGGSAQRRSGATAGQATALGRRGTAAQAQETDLAKRSGHVTLNLAAASSDVGRRSATAQSQATATVRRPGTAQPQAKAADRRASLTTAAAITTATQRRAAAVLPQKTASTLRAASTQPNATGTSRRSAQATPPTIGGLTLRGTATFSGIASRPLTEQVVLATVQGGRRSAVASLPLLSTSRRSGNTHAAGSALVIRGTATYSGVTSRYVLTSVVVVAGSRRAATASPSVLNSTSLRAGKATATALATIRVYIDGSPTPAAISTVAADGTFSIPLAGLLTGTHTIQVTAQAPGDTESAPSVYTVTILDEEEGDAMPAHVVNESSVSLSAGTATRIDPSPAAAKRYKIVVVNEHATDRIFVGYSNSVGVGVGQVVEADYGQAEFFVDSNVQLWAIRSSTNSVPLRIFEYVAA